MTPQVVDGPRRPAAGSPPSRRVQARFPDFVFSTLGPVDTRHRHARLRWGLGPAGAAPVVEGSDVVVTAADGRMTTVVGFLDTLPV